jgi:hypothetical protein
MKRILILGLVAAAIAYGLSRTAAADPNPATVDKDPLAYAYFDTMLTAIAGGDSISFGFLADWACVTTPASGTCTVQWIGKQTTLRRGIRKGLKLVSSVGYAMPVSATYCTGDVPGAFYGLKVSGTAVGILIQAGRTK